MSAYNLVRGRPKFTQVFLFNAELTVFDNAVYVLSISLSTSKICAIKFKSFCKTY